jgi:hypothetical protein
MSRLPQEIEPLVDWHEDSLWQAVAFENRAGYGQFREVKVWDAMDDSWFCL